MKPYRISLATAALLLVFWASACAAYSSQSGSTQQSSQRNHSEHLSTVSAKVFERSNLASTRRSTTYVGLVLWVILGT
jgi:hypothetical protein